MIIDLKNKLLRKNLVNKFLHEKYAVNCKNEQLVIIYVLCDWNNVDTTNFKQLMKSYKDNEILTVYVENNMLKVDNHHGDIPTLTLLDTKTFMDCLDEESDTVVKIMNLMLEKQRNNP